MFLETYRVTQAVVWCIQGVQRKNQNPLCIDFWTSNFTCKRLLFADLSGAREGRRDTWENIAITVFYLQLIHILFQREKGVHSRQEVLPGTFPSVAFPRKIIANKSGNIAKWDFCPLVRLGEEEMRWCLRHRLLDLKLLLSFCEKCNGLTPSLLVRATPLDTTRHCQCKLNERD